MNILKRLYSIWDYFGRWAEAVEADPLEEHRRRIEKLERTIYDSGLDRMLEEQSSASDKSRDSSRT